MSIRTYFFDLVVFILPNLPYQCKTKYGTQLLPLRCKNLI